MHRPDTWPFLNLIYGLAPVNRKKGNVRTRGVMPRPNEQSKLGALLCDQGDAEPPPRPAPLLTKLHRQLDTKPQLAQAAGCPRGRTAAARERERAADRAGDETADVQVAGTAHARVHGRGHGQRRTSRVTNIVVRWGWGFS